MSRRAGPDRAAENQQTIKTLLKLEGNKVCADCKKNKRIHILFELSYSILISDAPQIRDGQVGTLESLSASVAPASIEVWGLISVE